MKTLAVKVPYKLKGFGFVFFKKRKYNNNDNDDNNNNDDNNSNNVMTPKLV